MYILNKAEQVEGLSLVPSALSRYSGWQQLLAYLEFNSVKVAGEDPELGVPHRLNRSYLSSVA